MIQVQVTWTARGNMLCSFALLMVFALPINCSLAPCFCYKQLLLRFSLLTYSGWRVFCHFKYGKCGIDSVRGHDTGMWICIHMFSHLATYQWDDTWTKCEQNSLLAPLGHISSLCACAHRKSAWSTHWHDTDITDIQIGEAIGVGVRLRSDCARNQTEAPLGIYSLPIRKSMESYIHIYIYTYSTSVRDIYCICIYMYTKMIKNVHQSQPFPTIPNHSQPFPTIPNHSQPFPTIPNHSQPFPTHQKSVAHWAKVLLGSLSSISIRISLRWLRICLFYPFFTFCPFQTFKAWNFEKLLAAWGIESASSCHDRNQHISSPSNWWRNLLRNGSRA